MNIKDVIHYYMGCRCALSFVQPGSLNYNNNWKLISIESQSDKPYELDNGKEYTWTADIKPILRKLSSMTEEEILEFAILTFGEQNRDVTQQIIGSVKKLPRQAHHDAKFGTDVPYVAFKPNGANHYNGVVSARSLTSETMHYLLSRGFDLFSLIENNLAIDADTLKEQV
jgi:hypothetical protein